MNERVDDKLSRTLARYIGRSSKSFIDYCANSACQEADAFRHFNISMLDSLRVSLKAIQERISHALWGSFTLDVCGHTLDWKANENAAKGLGGEIAKAVAKAKSNPEGNFIDFDPLTAHPKEKLPSRDLEVIENTLTDLRHR